MRTNTLLVSRLARSFVLLFLWVCAVAAKGQTVYEDAAIAVNYTSHEEAAVRSVLACDEEVVRSFGEGAWELKAYVEWLKSGEVDTLMRRHSDALSAIVRTAERRYSAAHIVPLRCRFVKAITETCLRPTTDEMDNIIGCLKKLSGKEARQLRYICILAKTQTRDFDDPVFYDEIIETEKQVLRDFPMNSTGGDRWTAILYQTLAQAKASMTQVEEQAAAEKKGGNNGTLYNVTLLGTQNNALFYFQHAEKLYAELYPDEMHPERMSERHAMTFYTLFNFPITKEMVQDCEQTLRDCESYYGKKSLETIVAQMHLWYAQVLSELRIYLGYKISDMADYANAYLGDSNTNLVVLQSLAFAASVYDLKTLNKLLDRYERVAEAYATDDISRACLIFACFSQHKDVLRERAEAKMNDALQMYLASHNASSLSVSLGRNLANHYYYERHNIDITQQIFDCLCQDIKAVYGEQSQFYIMAENNRLVTLPTSQDEERLAGFKQLLAKARNTHSDYNVSTVLYSYIEAAMATRDFLLAKTLSEEMIGLSEKESGPDALANALLTHVEILNSLGASTAEEDKYFDRAVRLMEESTDSLGHILNNYLMAATHLERRGDYQRAIEMIDKGIECNDMYGGGLSADCIALYNKKISIQAYRLNDLVSAQSNLMRLMDWLNVDDTDYYTPSTLDVLWNNYYMMRSFNPNNVGTIFALLYRIRDVTLPLVEQSGRNTDFLVKYALPLMSEFFDVAAYILSSVSEKEIASYSDEQRALMQTFLLQMDGNIAEIESTVQFLQEEMNLGACYEYFNLLLSLSSVYSVYKKDAEKAEQCLLQAISLEGIDKNSKDRGLRYLAQHYITNKKFGKAEEVLAEIEKGDVNSNSLDNQTNYYGMLCQLNQQSGNYTAFAESARSYYSAVKKVMDGNFQFMTESGQNDFMNKFGNPAWWLNCAMEHAPKELAAEVYDASLYVTGMQLRSQRQTRRAIEQSGDAELKALADSLTRLHFLADTIVINYQSVVTPATEIAQQRYVKLLKQISLIETELMERTKEMRRRNSVDVAWSAVRDKLKDNEAAVEFVFADKRLYALLLKKGSESPQVIPLAENDELFKYLEKTSEMQAYGKTDFLYANADQHLYSMLWAGLEPYITDVNRIHHTTPGILNGIAFAAIRTPDGKCLSDKYDLLPVTTTAMLLAPVNNEKPKSALLMGNMLYSDTQKESYQSVASGKRDIGTETFEYLPSTVEEIAAIEKSLLKSGNAVKVTKRQTTQATEADFRQLINSKPSIIHLATHGYFLNSTEDLAEIPYYKEYDLQRLTSMQRAGIAFAGAEEAWQGMMTDKNSDGILTAEEVSKLDLSQTQLVCLSACETALGNYSSEGVFGLPRGFKVAGANSMIVSLWSVDDKSTALFMSEFYSQWLSGNSKSQAWRAALNQVRTHYPHPYYWAPFILLDALD